MVNEIIERVNRGWSMFCISAYYGITELQASRMVALYNYYHREK